jgi:nucleoside-diphosphate-sugar epimerase
MQEQGPPAGDLGAPAGHGDAMRVLLVGATSVFGKPLIEALQAAGHEVIGSSRSAGGCAEIEQRGASSVIADVLDRDALFPAVARLRPEAVISLLVTLPKNGPLRASQVHPNLRLWSHGVPNLIAAATYAGARRLLAESFVFAYGYEKYGPEPLTESSRLIGGAVIPGQAEILTGLRNMERAVVSAAGLEGIALRYGGRHGAEVPMTATLAKALRRGLPVLPGGGHALLPFIEVGDAARGTVAALEHGKGGEIYNIVDDHPAELHEYATALAASIGAPSPRAIPLWLVELVAPYMACVLDYTRLPVSNEKARESLGWEPRYPSLHDALGVRVG